MLGRAGVWTAKLGSGGGSTYVRSTRFASIGAGTSGTVTLPTGASVVLNDFGGTVNAVVVQMSGGFPLKTPALTATGTVVATTFDTSGNYSLSGTPAAYPVAILYRVRQAPSNYNDTDANIWGDAEDDIYAAGFNYTAQTAAYNAAINDYIVASGSSFAIVLPTAVGFAGKMISIQHAGSSQVQNYTLNTTSGQTVGGVASGAYTLFTNQEFLRLISDGLNWNIVSHVAMTPWTAVTIADFGSSFGVVSTQSFFRRRVGPSMELRGTFVAGTVTTGGNHVRIPTDVAINSSVMPLSGGANKFANVGMGGGTQTMSIVWDPSNPTYFQFSINGIGTTNGNSATTTGNIASVSVSIPIVGWQP